MKPLKILQELDLQSKIAENPSFPTDYIPKTKFTDKTAAGLEKAICRYIELKGGQAERIKNTGRLIKGTKVITDVLGYKKQIGSDRYIPGTGTNGTADVSATIKGRSVKIEVKIGKDRQSPDQKKYQESIERSGGLYFIARDFESTYKWLNETFEL